MPKLIKLFTDGSSRGNPGPGGYGAILQFIDDSGQLHEKELSAGYALTTNNRMELLGVIEGLSMINQPCDVVVQTDSQYIARAFNDNWIDSWISKNWKNSSNKPVKNKDLWQRLLNVSDKHNVTYKWIKGHAGHPLNERCDFLATSAADMSPSKLLTDEGYINNPE